MDFEMTVESFFFYVFIWFCLFFQLKEKESSFYMNIFKNIPFTRELVASSGTWSEEVEFHLFPVVTYIFCLDRRNAIWDLAKFLLFYSVGIMVMVI